MRINKTKVNRWITLNLVAAAIAVVCVPEANAEQQMLVQVDGGGVFQIAHGASGGLISFTGQICAAGIGIACGGTPIFDVSVSETSNSPGTATLAKLLSSTLDVTNDTSGLHTLEFFFGDTDFTAPTAPPALLLNSHVGGSVVVDGPANTMSFTSCVDQSNGQNTCGRANDADDVLAGPGTPNITTGSFKDDQTTVINSLVSSYSMSQYVNVQLDANSEVNFADNTTLAPAPEPASLALLGTGLLAFGFAGRKRSRKTA